MSHGTHVDKPATGTSAKPYPETHVDTPTAGTSAKPDPEERLHLASWGLPEVVLQNYNAKGISAMFEWQAECLCTGKVLGKYSCFNFKCPWHI